MSETVALDHHVIHFLFAPSTYICHLLTWKSPVVHLVLHLCVDTVNMSLADALLADLDGLSEDETPRSPSPPPAQPAASSSKGPGMMLPPPLPLKAQAAKQSGNGSTNGHANGSGLNGTRKRARDMDIDDEEEEDEEEAGQAGGEDGAGSDEGEEATGYVPEGGVRPAEELDAEEVSKTDMTGVEDVGKVAKLMNGRRLKEILEVSVFMSLNSPCDPG